MTPDTGNRGGRSTDQRGRPPRPGRTDRLRRVRWLALGLLGASLCGCRPPSPASPGLAASKGPGASIGQNAPPSHPSPSSTPAFRDIAREAGVTATPGHAGKSPLNIVETAGGGAGFIDYDGDDRLDIVLVANRVWLYRNEGNGRFRDVSAASGLTATGALMGVAVGDIDNDGAPDLYVTGHGVARLYRNRFPARRTDSTPAQPFFEDVTAGAGVGPQAPADWATSAGFADLDGDGYLDLVVCRYVAFTAASRQLCDYPAASGGTNVLASCPPLYYEPQRPRLFRNRGNGTFEEMTAKLPRGHGNGLGLAFADYNDDGRMDFYVANDALPGDLYRNEGHWRFTNVGTASGTAFNQDGQEQAGMGADWADYDGDGRVDLIVSTFQNEAKSLYHNEGNELFTYASYLAGIGDATKPRLAFGVGFLDYDNDGAPDLILANGHVQDTIARIHPPATFAQPSQLFHNRGDGTFEDVTAAAGRDVKRSIVGRGLAVGDLDDDGRPDVLLIDAEGAPLLLRNETRTGNHWLGLRLIGRDGRRDAVGARVTMTIDHRLYVAESQAGRSYLSSWDTRICRGLGTYVGAVEVRVRWPDGATSLHHIPAVDRYVTIRQPGGPPR